MKPLDPRLLRYARATRTHLVVSVVLGAVTALLVLAQAELLSRGIAGVVSEGMGQADLSGVMALLGVVIVGRVVVAWFQDSAAHRASATAKSQLRSAVIARAASLGPNAAAGRAEIATLTTQGLDALDGYFGLYLPQLVLAAIVPLVVLVRLFPADPTAAVIVLLTLPLIPVFMILVGRATEASNAKRWNALTRLSHHFLDVVSGMTTLKIFGRAKAQAASVRRTTDDYRVTTMATLRIAFLSSLVLELIATLSVALVAVSVGLRLVDGSLDLRLGLLVIILAPEAYLALRQVGVRYHAAAEGLAAAEQAFAVLDAPLPVHGSDTDVPDLRAAGSLEVHGVCVAHPGRFGFAPDAASFTASLGEIVVISGPSGIGKTTLLSVLLGARTPDLGDVEVIGAGRRRSLASLDPTAWRAQLAWVDQSPYLFRATLAENVRLSCPEATDVEVRAALDAAGLGQMAPQRLVDEGGRNLSSGERRRVALARAVLRDAPVLLLDEPTAGLDAQTELEVLTTIRRITRRSIVIMVSHRPAAIALADTLVVLAAENGIAGLVPA